MNKEFIYKSLTFLFQYFIYKAKALPPGTRRQRKDGLYEKQSDGKWIKVKDDKEKKKPDKENLSEKQKAMKQDYLNINQEGLNTKEYQSYHTPVLQIAFDLGQQGININELPVVTGYRYGKAPDSFISFNYTDNKSERGLSLAKIEGEEETGSSIWFLGRKKYKYTGYLLPYRGSDGEPLILAFNAENWGD